VRSFFRSLAWIDCFKHFPGMKAEVYVVAVLLVTTLARAESLKITTEEHLNKSGSRRMKITTSFRNGTKILDHVEVGPPTNRVTEMIVETVYYNGQKVMVQLRVLPSVRRKGDTERTYFAQSGAGIAEMDKDNDGTFDLVSVMDPGGKLHDSFTRNKEGWLVPISDSELKHAKELSKDVQGLMDDLTKPAPSDDTTRKRK
jgi:hypothetical protein